MVERVYLADKETLDDVKELVTNIPSSLTQIITPQTKKFTETVVGYLPNKSVTISGKSGRAVLACQTYMYITIDGGSQLEFANNVNCAITVYFNESITIQGKNSSYPVYYIVQT